ncbi:hypothetical protein J6590_056125 [Homalodisca vitripennis]|nr:hypothetical protein J6590_056125 [Homalodisca vitripennis]
MPITNRKCQDSEMQGLHVKAYYPLPVLRDWFTAAPTTDLTHPEYPVTPEVAQGGQQDTDGAPYEEENSSCPLQMGNIWRPSLLKYLGVMIDSKVVADLGRLKPNFGGSVPCKRRLFQHRGALRITSAYQTSSGSDRWSVSRLQSCYGEIGDLPPQDRGGQILLPKKSAAAALTASNAIAKREDVVPSDSSRTFNRGWNGSTKLKLF